MIGSKISKEKLETYRKKVEKKITLLLCFLYLHKIEVEDRQGIADRREKSKIYRCIQPKIGRFKAMRKRDKVVSAMTTFFSIKKSRKYKRNKRARL